MRLRALLLLLVLAAPLVAAPRALEVVAHRGSGKDRVNPDAPPENTLPALRWGFEQGADAGEIDVHATADGRAVLIHDYTTKRTTGTDWKVAERTMAELATLDAGAWKGPRWSGTRLPSLEEALAVVPEGRRLWVEVKPGPEAAPPVAEAVRASGVDPGRVVIISFNADTLARAKGLLPGCPAYLLVWFEADTRAARFLEGPGTGKPVPPVRSLDDLASLVEVWGFTGLDVSAGGPMEDLSAACSAAGVPWAAWTVNDLPAALDLARRGAFALTTDRPGEVGQALRAAGHPAGREAAPAGR